MLVTEIDQVVGCDSADCTTRHCPAQHELVATGGELEHLSLVEPEETPKLGRHDDPAELVDSTRRALDGHVASLPICHRSSSGRERTIGV